MADRRQGTMTNRVITTPWTRTSIPFVEWQGVMQGYGDVGYKTADNPIYGDIEINISISPRRCWLLHVTIKRGALNG